jgi:hypothetical protein
MCSGVSGALPNTHSRLTATLVIPSTGAPSLLAPTASPTPAASTSSSSWTTIKTSTSASSTRTTSSSSSTVTAIVTTLFPVSTAISSSTSIPASAPSSPSSSTTGLAPGQIAGISVGVAGAIAVAVGAILLAKCMRRRRYPDSDSEKGFYQTDNSTGGSLDPSGSRASRIFHISPPILRISRYRPDFIPRAAPPVPRAVQPEPPANTGNVDRGTIGLAISRPRSLIPAKPAPQPHSPMTSSPQPVQVPLERKPSKLLPPRPALTLDIPLKASTSGAPSSQAPPTTDRASTLTNMTAFADLDSAAADSEQVWRPPPSDPLSATTLYIADKYGNWVLSNHNRQSQIAEVRGVAELDTYTPLTKSPIEKQEEAAKMAAAISAAAPLGTAPQPAFLSQDPARPMYSRTSSFYSQASAPRQTGRRTSSSRNSLSKPRKVSSGSGAGRPDSKASVTTIQTSSTGGNDGRMSYEHDIARLSQLSPVKESPDPPRGRSQVAYPKIPGRLDGATIRYVPPPKRPNFSGSTSGQTSPTLGVVYPVVDSPSAYPLPLNPQRPPRPFAPTQRTGSGFTPEPPNVEVFPPQVSTRADRMPVSRQRLQPDPTSMPAVGSYQTVDSRDQGMRTPPQQAIPTFTPSPLSAERETRPPTPPEAGNEDRLRMHIASQYKTMSFRSSRTASSGASSLVAKRLGSDKAAALVLGPNRKKAQQWRRQDDDGVLFSPGATSLASPMGTLPMTPTWLPKLTPTRRGDDLYLNVQ